MKTFVPNYYKNFTCIANKCKHSCCIGWEIDIDNETLETYKSLKGKFSRKLKSGIDYKDDYACFKLDGKGRCVFLNEYDLCDIILNLGESSLCQVCADHPRFRSFFTDRTEIGLGLCCEEAGRIILGQNESFSLVEIENDNCDDELSFEEAEILKLRESLFAIIQNGNTHINEKFDKLVKISDYEMPVKSPSQWAEILISLERLDDYWTEILNELKSFDNIAISIPKEFNKAFENLLTYFVYRHINDIDFKEKIIFAVISCQIIEMLCKMHISKNGNITLNDIIEYSRLYSSEIEYSDENIEKIIDIITL